MAARQLLIYRGGFPVDPTFTLQEQQLLGGGKLLVGLTFVGGSWQAIETGNGIYGHWRRWLDLDPRRRAVQSIAMIPEYGPDHADPAKRWQTKIGTDAQVADGLRRGAAGEFDARWRKVAESLSGSLADAIIRLGWEFNGSWYAWRAGVDPAAFGRYWARIARILKERRPKLRIDWNAAGGRRMKTQLLNNAGDISLAWPGDVVDIVGVDHYDQRYGKTPAEGWKDSLAALTSIAEFAASKGKPMSIPEWGNWDVSRNRVEPDNPLYVRNMHAFIEANNVEYHGLFDTTAHDGDHRLTSTTARPTKFPKSAAAFRALRWRLEPLSA